MGRVKELAAEQERRPPVPVDLPICRAIRCCDEISCHRCGLVWGVNEERPECRTTAEVELEKLKALF